MDLGGYLLIGFVLHGFTSTHMNHWETQVVVVVVVLLLLLVVVVLLVVV